MKALLDFVTKGRAAQKAVDDLMPHGRPAHLPDYALQKECLVRALDSAINVVVETREWVQKHPEALNQGDKLKLSTTLQQMGRICYAVAEDCERGEP